jgi:uncharacterized OB-fold protein
MEAGETASTATMRTIPEPLHSFSDDQFWRFVESGEVRIQRCLACGTVRYPPEPVCPACLSADAVWEPLAGTGSLLAWTTFHRQYFSGFPVPYTVGAVLTDEGPIICAPVEGDPAESPRPGLRVRLVIEPVLREGGERSAIFSWHHDHDHALPQE